MKKTCDICETEKTHLEFYDTAIKGSKQNICKSCQNWRAFTSNAQKYIDSQYNGYMYVISNPAFKGWYKVGRALDLQKRLASYQTSSPFKDYKLEWFLPCPIPVIAEKRLNFEFGELVSGEWVSADLFEIVTSLSNSEIIIADVLSRGCVLKSDVYY